MGFANHGILEANDGSIWLEVLDQCKKCIVEMERPSRSFKVKRGEKNMYFVTCYLPLVTNKDGFTLN